MYEKDYIIHRLSTSNQSYGHIRDEFQELAIDGLWDKLNKLIKPNGAIVLFGAEPFSSALRMSNINAFKEGIIWQKDRASNFAQANKRHMKIHENIMVFGDAKTCFNKQMKPRKSQRVKQGIENKNEVWRNNQKDKDFVSLSNGYKKHSFDKYDKDLKNPESIVYNPIVNSTSLEKKEGKHPTQKPVKLMEYLIKTYTNENELVLDFTSGSGTTAVACENTNRKFIGIELDKTYFEIARNRIEKAMEGDMN